MKLKNLQRGIDIMKANKNTNSHKTAIVSQLKVDFSESPLLAFVDYNRITVTQVDEIRRTFEKSGIRYRVAKNTLMRLAIQGTDKESIHAYLKGMTGVVISGEDAIGTAKVLREISQSYKDTFSIKGGFFDGEPLDPQQLDKVADLPSKEDLLSMLLRAIQAPARDIMSVIEGPARDLFYLLKNYEQKLSETEE
jgi:large subunit ribosomal protein L10